MSVSYWRRGAGITESAADVVVIGAGICGVGAALALERRGLRVIVLEKGSLACGASGRNAGFLMRGCAENYAVACDTYGRARAARLWRFTEQNLDALRSEGVESLPGVQRIPSCLLAMEETEAEELARSAEMLRADGFHVGWVDRGSSPSDLVWKRGRAICGLVNPNDGAANSVQLLRFLASKLRSPVWEGRHVREIRESSVGVTIETNAERVHAARALVCVNGYLSSLLPEQAGLVRPVRGQMLALRARGAHPGLAMSYYANHGYEYFRQTVDGTIVLGGGRKQHAADEVGCEDTTTEAVQGFLDSFARDALGVEFDVVARWSGVMGFSADGLPVSGPVSVAGNVWFCGGFTGHGMSMGFLAAQQCVAAMLDNTPVEFPLPPAQEKSPATQRGA